MRKSILFPALVLVSMSSCLTTRSSMKRDSSPPASDDTAPAQVTEVKSLSNPKVADELKQEIERLSARVGDLEAQNQSLRDQNAKSQNLNQKQIEPLEKRMQELEAGQAQVIEELKKREKAEAVPQTEPTDLYNAGKAAFDAKKYEDAIDKLSGYLKFPKAKNGQEALWMRGESYHALTQYKKAILDYSAIRDQFPKAKRMPKVLLRIGTSFNALGDREDGKVFLQELVTKFPKTPEGKEGKKALSSKAR